MFQLQLDLTLLCQTFSISVVAHMLQGRPVVGALGRRPADRGMVEVPAADRSRPPSSLATNKACTGATIMASTYRELLFLVQAFRKHVCPLQMWVKRQTKDCCFLLI